MVQWIKTHKLTTILLLIILYFGFNYINNMRQSSMTDLAIPSFNQSYSVDSSAGMGGITSGRSLAPILSLPQNSYEKVSDTSNRLVIQDSTLSLVVKDVRETGNQILSYTKNLGGFMVNSSYNSPNESPFSQITVRIPTEKLDESLAHFRSLAIKVSSENLMGTDVTDQYQDLDARLTTLKTTKTKFEEILNKATAVQDILQVQQQIISLQQQIDDVTGQKMALADNAKLTKITLYLSTDELSLPYVPDTSFRPALVFKQAVRSLVNSLRAGAEMLIWLLVYAVIWIPLILAYLGFMRWNKSRMKKVTAN